MSFKKRLENFDWTKTLAILAVVLMFGLVVLIRLWIAGDQPHCFWAQDMGTCISIGKVDDNG